MGAFGRIWADLGAHLAKSKLDRAVEEHVGNLNDAQRELVLSQFSIYKQNKARLSELKDRMSAADGARTSTLAELRAKQATRSSLACEYNQLATANSRLASDLFNLLEERR